jgi:competence protein ComEA
MQDLSRADSWISKYKYPLILSFVGGVLMIGGLFSSQLFSHLQPQKKESFPKDTIINKAELFIKVDVSGQVNKPGVYSLAQDSRVEDAIKAAGGVTRLADGNYLTKTINLAQKISDGAKIYIPTRGESGPTSVLGASLLMPKIRL